MTWTCDLRPSDLYVAWGAGLCLGLCLGIVGARFWTAVVDWRRINEHSQKGPH